MSKNILVVTDMQNDFVTGSLGTKEAREIVPLVEQRIEKAINNNDDIIFTMDTHFDNYMTTKEGQKLPVSHCIKGTNGWEIIPELQKYLKYAKTIIEKNTFGSIEIPKYLNGYDNLYFIGLCTDICVLSNVIVSKAFYPNCNIYVEKNCCAGVSPASHERALEAMKVCHIDII